MRAGAYYNEIDPVAAEWLRRLIAAGLIADGDVDERDIRDVSPDELAGYVQCHFFAGIGIWSGALRAAGWPDDEPIWSGSCPCQPYSAAGRGEGVADERHLWPHWHWLIEQRRPRTVVGEQVASKDGLGWNDLVSADLAASGYAFASVDLAAGGLGLEWRGSAYEAWLERALHDCPDPMVARQLRNFADWAGQSLSIGGLHIRQRQYFVGVADEQGRGWGVGRDAAQPGPSGHADGGGGPSRGLPDAAGERSGPGLCGGDPGGHRGPDATDDGPDGRLVNGQRPRLERHRGDGEPSDEPGRESGPGPGQSAAEASQPGQLADAGRGGVQSGDGPGSQREAAGGDEGAAGQRQRGGPDDTASGAPSGMGDADGSRHVPGPHGRVLSAPEGKGPRDAEPDGPRESRQLGDPELRGRDEGVARDAGTAESPGGERGHEPDRSGGADRPGQADGRRSPFDWLLCRDGVWRATRPGTFPLAHAVAGRVGKLRAYGNGLDFETATEFCRTVREMRDEGLI